MSLPVSFKPTFYKAFDQLTNKDQILVLKTLSALNHYFQQGTAPYGLRIKKLHSGGSAKTFEARISLDLRLIWVQTNQKIIFSLLGNHADVKKFFKNL